LAFSAGVAALGAVLGGLCDAVAAATAIAATLGTVCLGPREALCASSGVGSVAGARAAPVVQERMLLTLPTFCGGGCSRRLGAPAPNGVGALEGAAVGWACVWSVAVVAVGAMGNLHGRLRAGKVSWARVGTAQALGR